MKAVFALSWSHVAHALVIVGFDIFFPSTAGLKISIHKCQKSFLS